MGVRLGVIWSQSYMRWVLSQLNITLMCGIKQLTIQMVSNIIIMFLYVSIIF